MASSSSASQSSPTPSFTYFPRLPVELRRLIWTLCLPGPRIISISHVKNFPCTRYSISSPPPVLLYVNQESRSFALQRYEWCLLQTRPISYFHERSIHMDCSPHDRHHAWIDLERDILFYENDFHKISSSQMFSVRGTRQSVVYDGQHNRRHFSWMSWTGQTSQSDSVVAHGENGDDKSRSALQKVTRVAIPYDEIYLDENKYNCGTGRFIQARARETELVDLTGALETEYFSSLRDVIVVVDREREDAKRREEKEAEEKRKRERKNGVLPKIDYDQFLNDTRQKLVVGCTSGKNVELIDLKPSERYDSKQCREMEEEVMKRFRNVGEGDTRPWFASALRLMEMRPKQEEPDYIWRRPTEKPEGENGPAKKRRKQATKTKASASVMDAVVPSRT